MVSGSPTEAQVYREPFFSLRRPSRSVVSRFLSHLLIRLMIVSALPGQWQAAAALFPVSMLWPLVAPEERASAPGDAGPETRVRGLDQKNASCVGREASQAAETRRGYELGYDGNAVERTVFTGYLWDKETNLFFAKARFYDPEVGRFISQDSYLGKIDNPPSLHRYFYANANPGRYTDATGHWSWEAAWKTVKAVPRAIAEPALEVYDVSLVAGAKVMGIAPEFIELQSALGRRQQERVEEGQGVLTAATKGVAEVGAAVVTRGVSVIGQSYAETAIDYSQGKLTVDQLDERLTSTATGTAVAAGAGAAFERAGGRSWTGRGTKPTRVIEGSDGNAKQVPATTDPVPTGEPVAPSSAAVPDSIYPAPLADRLAAFKAWRAEGGTAFGRFRGAHTPGARGQTLYQDPAQQRFGRWADSVDSPHGNSALSSDPAYLYRLDDAATGQRLKWGITEDPLGRYPASFMEDKRMVIQGQGPRQQMLRTERGLVEVDPGPLNREPWAGSRLEDLER